MRWLTDRFNREGPGIPKDVPARTGLALFAFTVRREAWELCKLNLLIVLFSLPVVTIPAAHAAAGRIATAMIRDENVYLLPDFWRAFRQVFLRASLAGAALAIAIGAGSYAVFVYGQLAVTGLAYSVPLGLCVAVTAGLAVFAVHLFVVVAGKNARLGQSARLAFIATLARPLPVLGALAFVAALWLAHVLFYPASIFMPAIFNFSLGVLALVFATGPGLAFAEKRLGPAVPNVPADAYPHSRYNKEEEIACETY